MSPMNFFYVKLPVGPRLEGSEQIFHDGLESALTVHHLGCVLGWGDSLSCANASEPPHLAFHRVDIEVTDIEPAVSLLRSTLVALEAPTGTEIHYTIDGAALQDIASSDGWRTEPCSTTRRHVTSGFSDGYTNS